MKYGTFEQSGKKSKSKTNLEEKEITALLDGGLNEVIERYENKNGAIPIK